MRKTVLLLASTALAMVLVCGVVWADTFTVKNNRDSGPGSLRAAINEANAEPGRDVITFAPDVRGEILLKSALPILRGEVEIRGPGASRLTVRRAVADDFGIFTVARGSTVTISGLTVSNGRVAVAGGGIRNAGDLTIRHSTFSGNEATVSGGGAYNSFHGHLTVVGSTFSANGANGGGGIANEGSLKVMNSTFSGNEADEVGGGINSSQEFSDLTVERSTFSGNRAGAGAGIHNRGHLSVEGSTFSRNVSSDGGPTGVGSGGGIHSDANLSVEGSTFLENRAGFAAGIFSGGTLTTIRKSTFSLNQAGYDGGGIQTNGGKLTVEGSTFSRNTARYGGGIDRIINTDDPVTIRNSTFSGNAATVAGGGIHSEYWSGSDGELTVVGSTFSGNTATVAGGGVQNDIESGSPSAAGFSLRMTLVARNEAPEGADASGPFRSLGHNLIGDPSGATGFRSTDLTNTRSGLDSRGLRDNGGPTETIALVESSPAVDAVEEGCPPPVTDQRGVSRPQNGDGEGTARCDIGAYERRVPSSQ